MWDAPLIAPDQRIRDLGVKLKFNPLPQMLKGQRMVVVDDSIVRGTTTPKVVDFNQTGRKRRKSICASAPPRLNTHVSFGGRYGYQKKN